MRKNDSAPENASGSEQSTRLRPAGIATRDNEKSQLTHRDRLVPLQLVSKETDAGVAIYDPDKMEVDGTEAWLLAPQTLAVDARAYR